MGHILIHFVWYWVFWKDIHHSFQNMSSLCESMEYWLYNFIFEFWSMMQQQKQMVSDFLKTHFLLNFGILFFPWKQYFIPFSTMFQCFNVASIDSAISFRSFDVSQKRWWECNIITTPKSYSILVFFFFHWKRFFVGFGLCNLSHGFLCFLNAAHVQSQGLIWHVEEWHIKCLAC